MPNLKYIVLSDLHLGEKGSLFTPLQKGNYAMINALSECLSQLLKDFNQKELPKLILNGDILGLSFSNYKVSLPIFEEFLTVFTQKKNICTNIIYIPGNHDHHIWSLTKEEEFRKRLKQRKANEEIPKLKSVSKPLYENGIDSEFFKVFSSSSAEVQKINIKIFYPNYLALPQNETDPYIMFHHGHFSENTYHFIFKAMKAFFPELNVPKKLEELEASNGSFIDFAFSELGRSGKAGEKFAHLMAILSDKEKLKANIDDLSNSIAEALDFPYLPFDFLESELTRTLLKNISQQIRSERYKGNTTCSDETMKGLMHYLNNYCEEVLDAYDLHNKKATLVWSHTHKPFQKITHTEKFGKLKIVNTGGWVLPPKPTPVIGASIVLVNEHNEVQSLRIYNDSDDGQQIKFKTTLAKDESETEFSRFINETVYNGNELKAPYQNFGDLILQEIHARRTNS